MRPHYTCKFFCISSSNQGQVCHSFHLCNDAFQLFTLHSIDWLEAFNANNCMGLGGPRFKSRQRYQLWLLKDIRWSAGKFSTLKIEMTHASEMLVHIRTTWRYILEDSNFYNYSNENPKSHNWIYLCKTFMGSVTIICSLLVWKIT
jgi:hypothetical protein